MSREIDRKVAERFLSHVQKTSGCWIWTASKKRKGYGQFWMNGKMYSAHRASWIIHHGVPAKPFICHHCDNPSCVNPNHLFEGDAKENAADMLSKGRELSGDKNPMRARPEVRLCGNEHWTAKIPERLARGSSCGNAKVCESDVVVIRELSQSGMTQRAIASLYGLSQSSVHSIISGRTWTHVS